MKTGKEIRLEWEALGGRYPQAVDPSTRACFDVLAPFRNGRRWPVYEHPVGPAEIDEVWQLAKKVAQAALGAHR